MTFSVLTVLRQSLRRMATGPALLVLLALAVVQWVAALVPGQFVRPTLGVIGAGAGGVPVVFTANPLPVIASVLAGIIGIYLSLVTIRVFASQWGIVEREHLTHRIGFGLLNLVGVSIVIAVVLVVGLVVLAGLLGLIGLILWLVLFLALIAASFFAPAFVAVEDDNVLTAFRKSGRVLAQQPLRVIGLLVALVFLNAVLQAVGNAVATALDSIALLGPLVLTVVSALWSVFLLITVARAYDHLDRPA